MSSNTFLITLEDIDKKLDWANRYSDRLVILSNRIFKKIIDLQKENDKYWSSDEYLFLKSKNKEVIAKIDVLARYGNILTNKVFKKLKVQ